MAIVAKCCFAARFLLFSGGHVFYEPSDLVQDDACMVVLFSKLDAFAHATGDDGKTLKPVTMPLTPEAQKVFDDWYMTHDRKTAALDGKKNSFYGKLGGEALAISVILESMKDVIEGNQSTTISLESIKNAVKTMDFYFIPMIDLVLGGVGDEPVIRAARTLGLEIIKRKPATINSTEIRLKWKIEGLRAAKPIHEAVQSLIDLNWLDWSEKAKGGSTGKRKSEWTVNPLVYSALSEAPNATKGANKGFAGQSEANQEQPNAKEETYLNAFDLHLKEGEDHNYRAFGANGAFDQGEERKEPD